MSGNFGVMLDASLGDETNPTVAGFTLLDLIVGTNGGPLFWHLQHPPQGDRESKRSR